MSRPKKSKVRGPLLRTEGRAAAQKQDEVLGLARDRGDTEAGEAFDRHARSLGAIPSIRTPPATPAYRDGWDRIFGRKSG